EGPAAAFHAVGIQAFGDRRSVDAVCGPATALFPFHVRSFLAYAASDLLFRRTLMVQFPRAVFLIGLVVSLMIGIAVREPAAPQAVHLPFLERADRFLLPVLEPALPFTFLHAVHVRSFL